LKFKGILEFLPKFGADDISHCLSGQTSYGSRLSILAANAIAASSSGK
jgi:hypothetical protein